MKPSEKRSYLFSHAFSALCSLRRIDLEHESEQGDPQTEDEVAAEQAMSELQAAMEGRSALPDAEMSIMRPVIEAWRRAAAISNDDDDGTEFEAFCAEISPIVNQLLDDLPVFEYVPVEGPFERDASDVRF